MSARQHGEAKAVSSESARVGAAPAAGPLIDLQRAADESSHSLDTDVRARLEVGLGRDFSSVRVHSGPQSARAAERMGARAYTLGNDIHLGAEARTLSNGERSHLLAHEAAHTVQQGGGRVAPHAGLGVSSPNDAAEAEAEHIAQTLHSPRSPSLALRDSRRSAPLAVARSVVPQLQRDLTDKVPVGGGDFKMNMKTRSNPGAKSGMSGTIKFRANDKGPDSTNIRLLQVARLEDLSTGKDYVWTGGEANRNKIMDGGFFVDRIHASLTPRTNKANKAASPYYIEDYPGTADNQDGTKKGKAVTQASLADFPGWSQKCRFTFETVAKAAGTGHVYGTVTWGFTISDGTKGTVNKEYAKGRNVTLMTTDKAIEKFNEFYRNPGVSTAP